MLHIKAYKLLYYIIKRFKKDFKRPPNRTELIKLSYLADLEYYKNYGEKYSEFNYIFYHRGPWTRQYHELIDYMNGYEITESRQVSSDGKEFFLYFPTNIEPRHAPDIEEDIKNILENNFFIYKESDLSQLLEVVYKNEPMVSSKRGEVIDFSRVFMKARNKRLQYRTKRKNQLMKINKIENNIKEDDLDLYSELKVYRKRANELL